MDINNLIIENIDNPHEIDVCDHGRTETQHGVTINSLLIVPTVLY